MCIYKSLPWNKSQVLKNYSNGSSFKCIFCFLKKKNRYCLAVVPWHDLESVCPFLISWYFFLHSYTTHPRTHTHTLHYLHQRRHSSLSLSLSRSQIIHLPLTLLLLLALSPCLGLAHAVSVPFSLSICLFFVYKFTHNYKNNNNYFTDPQSRKSCSPTSKLRICY